MITTLLTESMEKIKQNGLPPPYEDKFPVHFSREKNCYVVRKDATHTEADGKEFTHHHDRSLDYMPQLDATAILNPDGNSNKKKE